MLSAYFDTNVYDHIDKGRISEDDVVGLHAALSSKRLGILLGIGDVEELLGHWEADRAEVLRALRLIEAVAGFGRLVRQPHEILEEAIRAYAEEAPPPSMLASPAECLVISDAVGRILTIRRSSVTTS